MTRLLAIQTVIPTVTTKLAMEFTFGERHSPKNNFYVPELT